MIRRRRLGFTLLEILIGLFLGALLAATALSVFISNKNTYRNIDGLSRLQEAGRFALDFLTTDLRQAGFQGCLSMAPRDASGVVFQYALNDDNWYDFRQPVRGFDASGGTWSPALDAAFSAALGASPTPLAGSDVLSIRLSQRLPGTLSAPMAGVTAPLTLSAGSGLRQDDVLILADCRGTAVTQITQAANGDTEFSHAAGTGTAPQNATASLGQTFAGDAELFRGVVKTYYVAPAADRPGGLALWEVTNPRPGAAAAPRQLIDGVENMQVLYGIDNTGDLSPNRYVGAAGVGDWDAVVAVQVELLLRTLEDNLSSDPHGYVFAGTTVSDPGDRRIRRTFTATVGVRNNLN